MNRSTSRIDPRAGWTNGKRRPCRECGADPPKGRRTFCSDACVDTWKVRSQPAFAAQKVLERDRGVCADCGLDCVAVREEVRRMKWQPTRRYDYQTCTYFECAEGTAANAANVERCRALDLPVHIARGGRRLWEMDHIVPVVEGGGSCGLDNLRTLCWRCHRRVTAELAARRAEQRRAAKATVDPQTKLAGMI